MHSHLIPGIDDGSKEMEQTLALLMRFQELGYRKVITTPHIMQDFYRNTPEIILEKLKEVKKEAKELALDIQIEAAAEYYYDETLIPKIKEKSLLTFGNQYVLFEYAFLQEPKNITSLLFEFNVNGYHPILAHYERYPYYHNKIDKIEEYKTAGVSLQLNLLSLCGHYGPQVEKMAKYLVDNRLIDFVGTDCHRMEHLEILEKNKNNKYFSKIMDLPLLNNSL
ncbi:MAG: capsular biosynthesis protein [Flavobacteriia bacterium]|nr:capsular biosynthesis protein [Flavobacteriia bacterium]